MTTGTITRRFHFCASHRYWVEAWSEEKNRSVFGRRTTPYGHGHNYMLDVTLKGAIDETTGMVINLSEVKRIVGAVVDRFDHKFLNADLPFFKNRQPTAENLARLFWELIEPDLPEGACLHRIRLYTTPLIFAEYHGDRSAIFSKTYSFSSTHRLHSEQLTDEENCQVYGKCNNENGHGHNYALTVYVKKPVDPVTGMGIPLVELDRLVKDTVLRELEGKRLDEEVAGLSGKPATSENLLLFIREKLQAGLGSCLWKLKLKETDNNFFEIEEEYHE